MKKCFLGASSILLLFIYIFNLLFCGGFHTKSGDLTAVECYTGAVISENGCVSCAKTALEGVEVGSRLWELLFGGKNNESEPVMLYPGGGVFGIRIVEAGVTVTSGSESHTFRPGDRIVGIFGKEITDVADIEAAVKSSGGKLISFNVIRGGEKITLNATPALVDGEYKLGIKLRGETAGIGTVTYVNPETREFGGLGHGVSDAETGAPVTIKRAEVKDVMLGGCKRGEPGKAGELSGVLKKDVLGGIEVNCECGVFGSLDAIPDYCDEAIPAARRGEVKAGEAEIISTVKNGYRAKYKIEICDIDLSSTGSKSFKIKVTDPALIAITGGIVRGMSGSPIIQDGKLVGAVTHVLVANPTEGYGIFIENMLSAANEGALPKVA